jgi:subtilisin family serine protease
MPGFEDKFDSGLSRIYAAFQRERRGEQQWDLDLPQPKDGLLNVTIQYTGDLATIEALGFQTRWQEGPGRATGTVDLGELEPLGNHPGILSMSFGEPAEPVLDISVPDIKANLVWPTGGGPYKGAGVLVGIIDTGIDWAHDFFLRSTAPKQTRIRRIWDQGLTKQGAEVTPFGGGLAGAPDYGVEYKDTHIDDRLQHGAAAPEVRHFDCIGHGTHVASIAAGDGRPAFTYVGVAPEADLVVVKFLDRQNEPVDSMGVPIPNSQQFKDAVNYILLVADSLGQPVVINMSFGSFLGPHDGFTDEEDFLTHTFPPATAGKICVVAAGNWANKRQHARIEFSAAGTVEIPLELFDERGAKKLDYQRCLQVWGTRPAGVQVWYPSGSTLTGAVKLPDGGPFRTADGVLAGRAYQFFNATASQMLRSGAGTVTRKRFEFVINPFRNRHVLGTYMLRLTATGPLVAHLWCRRGRGKEGMRIGPAGAFVDTALIGQYGGSSGAVTVAAYDAEVATKATTDFSSRGPLVSFGGLPVAQPAKPDIAAPGKSVDAAKGRSAAPWGPAQTTPKNGTSMAAPHVTGVVALMLQKKPTMTVADALTTLKGQARTVPPVVPDDVGAGRIDAKKAFDNVP